VPLSGYIARFGVLYAIICHMKRTTIFVPEDLERDLQLYARRQGRPTAAIIREALTAYIASKQSSSGLPSFVGAFDSGHTDTAERHEEILFRNLDRPREPTAARRHKTRTKEPRATVRRRG
jgi:predicted transcriptional regulator